MAEFSKEYCDVWDHGFPHDFSIQEVAKDLYRGNYYPIICEGFGFVAIAKDKDDKILLAFSDDDDKITWQEYNTFMSSQFALLQEEIDKANDERIF